jgi:hypothetical protein
MKTSTGITKAISTLLMGKLEDSIRLAKPFSILHIIDRAECLGHSLSQSIAIASFLKGFIPFKSFKNLFDKDW